jgi:hypothetical protein
VVEIDLQIFPLEHSHIPQDLEAAAGAQQQVLEGQAGTSGGSSANNGDEAADTATLPRPSAREKMPTPRKGLPKRRPSLRRRKTLALMKAQRQLLIMPFLPSRHRPLRRYPHHPQRSLRTTTIQPIPCQLQAPTASQPAAHPAVAASRIIQVSFVLPVALRCRLELIA